MSNKLIINFHSDSNTKLAELTIFGDGEISELKENGHYEYELNSTEYLMKEKSRVIKCSRINKGNDRGLIDPGNYVGLLMHIHQRDHGHARCVLITPFLFDDKRQSAIPKRGIKLSDLMKGAKLKP
ncbi:hypothetical protein H8D64_02380 [PVC group bacterium]|nr:hypothetical protein [PVC group bacterium]